MRIGQGALIGRRVTGRRLSPHRASQRRDRHRGMQHRPRTTASWHWRGSPSGRSYTGPAVYITDINHGYIDSTEPSTPISESRRCRRRQQLDRYQQRGVARHGAGEHVGPPRQHCVGTVPARCIVPARPPASSAARGGTAGVGIGRRGGPRVQHERGSVRPLLASLLVFYPPYIDVDTTEPEKLG